MSSVLVACMAPIALCHLTRDHLTRSLKSRNATVGDKTWNPGFKSVTLLKVTGGLMDREFVLLRAILRAVLPDRLETSFVSPSYIYLEIPLTEFFCNLSVQPL